MGTDGIFGLKGLSLLTKRITSQHTDISWLCQKTPTQKHWISIKRSKCTFSFIIGLSAQDSSLDCSTKSNHFGWVHTLVGLFSFKVVSQKLLDFWYPCASADKDYFVNLVLFQAGIIHCFLYIVQGLSKQIVVQGFKM